MQAFRGDRIIISASAIPGNEKAVSRIINELYRKGADVVYEKSEGLHVSGHACQEELKIIHGLVRPKFFLPVHGEQRHLQLHGKLAKQMGMNPKNIRIPEIGGVLELTAVEAVKMVRSFSAYMNEKRADQQRKDINSDGTISNEDVLDLLWHILFAEGNTISGDGDIDRDGTVTNTDVVELLWYMLFSEDQVHNTLN